MKQVNMIIQDDDMKILKPLLERLELNYTSKTIKEDKDPIIMLEATKVKNDKPASKKENADFQAWMKRKIS